MSNHILHCRKCGKTYQESNDIYLCECGANLFVKMDLEKIAKTVDPATIKADPDHSIWRYSPLLPINRKGPLPKPLVGCTPVYQANALAKNLGIGNLVLKDDGRNPSGSFKDRAGAIVMARALDAKIPVIVAASTGNAASSMACLAADTPAEIVLFVPEKAPEAKVAQLLIFGAKVIKVKGNYDDAFELALAATKKFGWYNRNTAYNPYTRDGKKTCSFELWEQLGDNMPDYLFVASGDGNIISGICKGFEELVELGWLKKSPKIVSVQAAGSDAIVTSLQTGNPVKPVTGITVADSISIAMPCDSDAAIAGVKKSGGFGVRVTDDEILDEIPVIAQLSGVFAEPAGATPVAGIRKAAKEGLLPPDASVVAVVTGNGLKDIASALKRCPQAMLVEANEKSLDQLENLFS